MTVGDAVAVRAAWKTHPGNVAVLKGLDMTVDDGSIYGLLGASGCGKTTLLNCILGLNHLDDGEIEVFGKTAGILGRTVGYMSQDIALYMRFTVDETLSFFGNIHGMTRSDVQARSEFLSQLFQLPVGRRIVGSLSGGQKRRVSLAVAILHNPPLLILDEPTVGVDAMLRKSIWLYLRILCEEGRTVLIATHYIEEARQADKIGLMSEGRILAQDAPVALLERHGVASIEDVFVKVSQRTHADAWKKAVKLLELQQVPSKPRKHQLPRIERGKRFAAFRGLIWKNVSHMIRSPIEMLFYFLVPSVCLSIMYTTIGNPPRHLPIAVVNPEYHDGYCQSHHMCEPANLSCNFLAELDTDMVTLSPYDEEDVALAALRRGDVWGVVVIPHNFSVNLDARFTGGLRTSPEILNGSQIHLTFDMTNQQLSLFVYRMITDTFQSFAKKYMSSCGHPPESVSLPVLMTNPVYGDSGSTFGEFVALAFSILFATTVLQIYSSSAYVKEKQDGVLDRLWISGMKSRTLFLTNIIVQHIIMIFVMLFSFSVASVAFELHIEGSLFWFSVLVFLQGSSAIAIGNLLSLIINNETLLIEIIMCLFVSGTLFGGAVWPLETLDAYSYYITAAMPLTLSITSMRHIVFHGWLPWHPRVWPGFLVIFGWDVALYSAVFIVVATSRRKWKTALNKSSQVCLAKLENGNVNHLDCDKETSRVLLAPALSVNSAWKKYFRADKPVLQGLNMTVPEGSIYGLLGASGCGKTTLLNCILGFNQLDSGTVSIYGSPAGSKGLGIPGRTVGYMSQDVALYALFTVSETLSFFGNMYGMPAKAIRDRVQFLSCLFSLPLGSRRVASLSGGQKRRVSLAVALLHEPRLIVLDEPTVGVDSVIRNSIWKYLRVLSEEGRTIIITTHYLEEAVTADKVGLMRDGVLLAEDSPTALMKLHGASTLEDVFVKVCQTQNSEEWAKTEALLSLEESKTANGNANVTSNYVYRRSTCWQASGFRGILWKNFTHIARSPFEVVFYFIVPMIAVILINVSFGNTPRHLPIALVNYERPDSPICDSHPYCVPIDLSCNFIDGLDRQMVELVPFPNTTDALDAVRRGETWGIITIPSDFSNHLERRFSKGNKADLDEIVGSQIQLTFDMTNEQLVLFTYHMIMEAVGSFAKKFITTCKRPPEALSFPVVIDEPIHGSMELTFGVYFVPGVMIFAACFMIQIYSSFTYSKEKRDGVLDRLYVSGLSTRTLFFTSVLVQYLMMIVIFCTSFAVAFFGFGLPLEGSLVLLILLILLVGSGAIATGNLVSIFIDNDTLLVEVILSMFLAAMLCCGVMWPTEAMNPYLYIVVMVIVPHTLPLASCRHILMHGWDLLHPKVWPGFVAALVWDVVLFGALYFITARLRRKKRKSVLKR